MADFTVNMTGTVEVNDSIKQDFEVNAILEYTQSNVIDNVVQFKRELNAKSISLPRYSALAQAITPLVEKDDVVSEALADTQIILTPLEYGNVVTSTNLGDLQSGGTLTQTAVRLVGKNMGETTNKLGTLALEASTNVVYGGGAANEGAIVAGDVMDAALLDVVYNKMSRKNVPFFDGRAYIAFMHDDVITDLRKETGAGSWQDVNKYTDAITPLMNEIGMYKGFRIIRNNDCSLNQDAGDTNVDTYYTSFVGFNGLGLAQSQIPAIVVSGPFDKLQRFMNIGWYGVLQYKIIEDTAVWKGITSSSVGSNV